MLEKSNLEFFADRFEGRVQEFLLSFLFRDCSPLLLLQYSYSLLRLDILVLQLGKGSQLWPRAKAG